MPYKSDAQRRYFNANRSELEEQGVDVDEWNESSKGKKLPEKVKEKESFDQAHSLLSSLKDNAAKTLQKAKSNTLDSFKDKALNAFQNAKSTIESIPRKAYEFGGMQRGANLGGRIVPSMLMGGLLGGGLGLYQDPGEDEQGRKRSRIANALGLGLGGAALGGTSAYFAPEASQLGRNVGAQLGSLLGGLKYDLSKTGNDRAAKARTEKAYDLGQVLGSLSLRSQEKQADWSSYIPTMAALGVGGLAGYGFGNAGGYESGHSKGWDEGYDEGTRISKKDNMKALLRGLHQVMQQGTDSDVNIADLVGHDDDYASRLELNRKQI
jgi:hypothetical protein